MFDGCCSDAAFTTSWHFSLVYGEPNVQLRRSMWNKVLNMGKPKSILWLLMGDLNLVGDSSDKKGKRPPLVTDKRILEDLICSCLLREVIYKGPQYTWSKGHIQERLDRAMINDQWSQLFPNAQLFHCTRIGSDHCPLLLCLKAIPACFKKQFRYELKWQLQDGYAGVISRGWSTDRSGSPLFCMTFKLAHCQKNSIDWCKSSLANSRQELENLQQELDRIQLEEQSEMNDQRQKIIVYTSQASCNYDQIAGLIRPFITLEMNEELRRPVSNAEIQAAVFQQGAFKALGVDGFPGCFFQQHWDLVGEDVCKAVKHFFENRLMLKEMNKTRITLIPKIKNLESVFIPGRAIQDNILIAHEAFHGLHLKKKGKHGIVALKLDIQKAFVEILITAFKIFGGVNKKMKEKCGGLVGSASRRANMWEVWVSKIFIVLISLC
ncbi:hypothetical protein SLEP1_g9166 [Rubroshorea leprosula]|uniref:Reverse transcriptase n=1 Tax=Rubroshorea leprosula TaxID=152421 RepID=A0AAV5ID94_9ROSI|nr:hypothetical protein SLEP1_g9166 [Rubroshorea leprosula]